MSVFGRREKVLDRDSSTDSDSTYDSTSASSSRNEQETVRADSDCDRMVEKWRLIRLADKLRPQKKVDAASVASLAGN